MKKKYFVVIDFDVGGTSHNIDWNKRDAIQWAKEIAQQGHTVQVYEGEFIKGFSCKINVIDYNKS